MILAVFADKDKTRVGDKNRLAVVALADHHFRGLFVAVFAKPNLGLKEKKPNEKENAGHSLILNVF